LLLPWPFRAGAKTTTSQNEERKMPGRESKTSNEVSKRKGGK